MSPVGAEGHAVDRLLVFSQRVDTDSSVYVPETHRGVKGSTGDEGDEETLNRLIKSQASKLWIYVNLL